MFIFLTTKGFDSSGVLGYDTSFLIKLTRYKDEKTNNYSTNDVFHEPRGFWEW